MSSRRIPSPARSQGADVTPRPRKSRSTRSVGSPARSTASGRLTDVIRLRDQNKDSFFLSPLPKRRSVLNDDTDIEEPRRKSWWKKLDENSRDELEVFKENKGPETNAAVEEYIDIEVLSQEKKNYTLDLPESSDGESISSIVIPQRKLFTHKDNPTQQKFGQIMGKRETLAKLHKTAVEDKTITVAPKNLFNKDSRPRTKPVFPDALLNLSYNKTINKTKEMVAAEVKGQARNLFGNRPGTKRKNMFADFIVSDSEDEISEIQPKVFGFQKDTQKTDSPSRSKRDLSPTSSIATDVEIDDWGFLPSSTMVEHQIEDMMGAARTPVKRPKLSKVAEIKELSINKSNKSNKSNIDNNVYTKQNKSLNISNKTLNASNKTQNTSKHTLNISKHTQNISNKTQNVSVQIKNVSIQSQNKVNEKVTKESNEVSSDEDEMSMSLQYEEQDVEIHRAQSESHKENQKNDINVNDQLPRQPLKVSNKSLEVNNLKISANEEQIKNRTLKDATINETNSNFPSNLSISNSGKLQTLKVINQSISQNKSRNIESIIRSDETRNNAEINNENVDHNKIDIKNKPIDIVFNQKKNYIEHGHSSMDVNWHELDVDNEQDKLEQDHNESEAESNQLGSKNKMDNNQKNIKDQEAEELEEADINNKDQENDDSQKAVIDSHEIEQRNESNKKAIEESQENDNQDESGRNVIKDSQGCDDPDESEEKIIKENQESDNENNSEENVVEEDDEEENVIEENGEEDNVQEDDEVIEENQSEDDNQNQSEVIQDDQNESKIIEDQEEIMNESHEDKADESHDKVDDESGNEEQNNGESDDEEPNIDGSDDEEQNIYENEDDEQSIEESDNDQQNNDEDEEDEQEENGMNVQDENKEVEKLQDLDDSQEIEEQNEQEESEEMDQQESEEETEYTNDDVPDNKPIESEQTPNTSHDTTSRNRNKEKVDSPEAILHDKTNMLESFVVKGRNTSLRRTSMMRNMNIRPSVAPSRGSTGLSDGTGNSSVEGSGWDSHRTTRKTIRQTFGKDFSPRKSLRALVMEKSAKRQTTVNDLTSVTSKFPQANSTELPEASNIHEDDDVATEANHDVSKRTRQTTLEAYLQKIKEQNMERKFKMEEVVRNSLKAPARDISNPFKVPLKPMFPARKSSTKQVQKKPKSKQIKSALLSLENLPPEVLEDMKYKPPKRFQPSNAAWITKRLYKYLENKLEPKYDYKARVRAEKLVQTIYNFAKDLRRPDAASADAVNGLKLEMARLDIVRTHFEFYQFFHDYMPREVRVKVVPDVVNKIPLPRHGIFSDILRGNTVQG